MRSSSRMLLATPVLVLAVASALSGCADDSGSSSADPSTSTSPGDSSASPSDPADTPGTDAGLPSGDAPAVDWAQGNVLHRADGTEVTLQLDADWGVTAVMRSGEDLFVTDGRLFEQTVGMHRLRADGTRRGSWRATGPAVKADDGTIAWVDVVMAEDGEASRARIHVPGRSQRLSEQRMPYVLGYVDGEVIFTAGVKASGNRWAQRQFATDLTAPPKRVKALPVRVMSPGGTNWYEISEDSLSTSISGHVDSYGLDRIAVDSPPVWEDDENLLVRYVDGGRATLARITPDGDLERTLDWTDATAQAWAVAIG